MMVIHLDLVVGKESHLWSKLSTAVGTHQRLWESLAKVRVALSFSSKQSVMFTV